MVWCFLFSWVIFDSSFYDYGVGPLRLGSDYFGYTPISFEHFPTIVVLAFVALTGFFMLRFLRRKLPPIPMCLCLSAVFIGIVLSVVYGAQIIGSLFSRGFLNAEIFFLLLYPLNFVLCSIRLVWQCVSEELTRLGSDHHQDKVVDTCKKSLTAGKTWLIVFALTFPLLIVVLTALILLGQAPDAAIRAFTQTSDWTFSAHDWPHPGYLPHEGHYLCAVALRGNAAIVKPLRLGIRRGERIVVNRQLCVANAFEQCIMEKAPHFHRMIRGAYDRHGYPLSKHITTKSRANATYILMKPFEWAFVAFLYTVDKHPENRIAAQYLGFANFGVVGNSLQPCEKSV